MAAAYPEDVSGTLLDALECPVCLEYVQPPILQCENGHCICKDCLAEEKISVCPLCKVNIEKPCRSLIADKLVKGILFPCKFSKDGCKEKMLIHEIIVHHKKCGYFTECDIGTCSWRGPLSSLMEHVDIEHGNCASREEYTTICFKVPIQPEEHVTIIEAHKKLFRNSFTYVEDDMSLIGNVQYLGPANDNSSFEYQYEFSSPNGDYTLLYQQIVFPEKGGDTMVHLKIDDKMLQKLYVDGREMLLTCSIRIIRN